MKSLYCACLPLVAPIVIKQDLWGLVSLVADFLLFLYFYSCELSVIFVDDWMLNCKCKLNVFDLEFLTNVVMVCVRGINTRIGCVQSSRTFSLVINRSFIPA
ncbi:hypothetical protein Droror1_Dr00020965 [Drosera rotundifolia]